MSSPTVLATSPLPITIQFMRYCENCDREQIFIAGWECEVGLVGCCLGCGDERIAPFTRVTEKVA
jgi:sulfite reductase beta subunit-like hemoprotein